MQVSHGSWTDPSTGITEKCVIKVCTPASTVECAHGIERFKTGRAMCTALCLFFASLLLGKGCAVLLYCTVLRCTIYCKAWEFNLTGVLLLAV